MSWEVDGRRQKRLADIANAVKDADGLILATDPDREGEAISWHVLEVLKQKKVLKDKPVSRVVFNAITKQAVLDAMANPREIDVPLVDAYLARRALDYLVGFTLSPVLWRKLPGARSAGRVQSVALRLVCDREAEIERFKPRGILVRSPPSSTTPRNEDFEARLVGFDGKTPEKLDIQTRRQRRRIKAMLEGAAFKRRCRSRRSRPSAIPYPPFTTSTLQQDASSQARLLGHRAPCRSRSGSTKASTSAARPSASSPICEPTACRWRPRRSTPRAARSSSEFGARLPAGEAAPLSDQGQERPGSARGDPPDRLLAHAGLGAQVSRCRPARLYDLIWKRTIASQMARPRSSAPPSRSTRRTARRNVELRAVGSVVTLRRLPRALWRRGRRTTDDRGRRGQPRCRAIARRRDARPQDRSTSTQHFTEPPPRYSEAT